MKTASTEHLLYVEHHSKCFIQVEWPDSQSPRLLLAALGNEEPETRRAKEQAPGAAQAAECGIHVPPAAPLSPHGSALHHACSMVSRFLFILSLTQTLVLKLGVPEGVGWGAPHQGLQLLAGPSTPLLCTVSSHNV